MLETRGGERRSQMECQNSDRLTVDYANNYEYLADPFTISPGRDAPDWRLRLPDGERVLFAGHAASRVGQRPPWPEASFYDGTKTAVSYSGRVKLTNQFSLEPPISFNVVDLREGSFTTNVLSARTTFTFSPRTFLSALLQDNSSSHAFTTNVRFRWEYQPGSEVFVVYSEGRDTNASGFPVLQNRGFVVKLTKLFRY